MHIWSKEQLDIIHSNESIIVNSCGGSGKTTVAVEYARNRPKVLYLAYNKVIAEEVKRKVGNNVTVCTSHSLAYRYWTTKGKQIRFLTLNKKFLETYFPTISNSQVNLIKYQIDKFACSDLSEEDFFKENWLYNEEPGYKQMLKEMRDFKTGVTHDLYLKFYADLKLDLGYSHVIFDEAADISGNQKLIIESQVNSTKLLLGDTMQSIYGFRHCINGFDIFPYKPLFLTTSYRMNQDVAAISNFVANFGKLYGANIKPAKGFGKKVNDTVCYISATNFGVFQEIVNCNEDFQVVGEYDWTQVINDMFDLYELTRSAPDKSKMKSSFLKVFKNLDHFYAYITDAKMLEWSGLLKFVKTFGSTGIYELKRKVSNQTTGANVYISNTHKAKGLEWNTVILNDDFATLEDIVYKYKDGFNNREALNVFYVACTRAMTNLEIPHSHKKCIPTWVTESDLWQVK